MRRRRGGEEEEERGGWRAHEKSERLAQAGGGGGGRQRPEVEQPAQRVDLQAQLVRGRLVRGDGERRREQQRREAHGELLAAHLVGLGVLRHALQVVEQEDGRELQDWIGSEPSGT